MKAIFPLFFIFYSACQLDYFSWSSSQVNSTVEDGLSQSATDNMVYCNKFDTKGFSGILTAYYDLEKDGFDNNKAQLYLWKVPAEFQYPPTNYIQLHLFRIEEGQETFHKSPVPIDLISKITGTSSYLIKALDHRLLDEQRSPSIDHFLNTYIFILKDIRGWQGLTLSVFNENNKPIKSAQVLLPPFPADPRVYLTRNNKERALQNLHPFANLSHTKETDRVFYEKGLDFCKGSPVNFDVPAFEKQGPASLDQLLDEFSFLPE